MATNIPEIKQFLEDLNLKYKDYAGKDFLRVGFGSEHYKDSDGDNHISVVVALEENGEFIKFIVPDAYKFDTNLSSFHKMALFQTLLQVSHMTKMMQFEYDVDDGDIWAIIEFPLEDSKLTKTQLKRCLVSMVGVLDKYHEIIVDAIKHGITPESEKQQRKAFEEYQRARREERRQQLGNE
jgi:hypothetical protein